MSSTDRAGRAGSARLGLQEEAYLLAEQTLGIAAPMQVAWVFDTDPGVEAVVGMTDALARGWIDRSVRLRHVPVARHRWVRATGSAHPRVDTGPIDDDAVHDWVVAHTETTPLPVIGGRGWQVATVSTVSGRRVVSFIASHVLADGSRFVDEASRALSGQRGQPMVESDPPGRAAQRREDLADAATAARAAGRALRRVVTAKRPEPTGPAARRPAGEPTHRDRPAANTTVTVDAAQWAGVAADHGGTSNSLFAAVIGAIAQRAGVSTGATTISVAVDHRDADSADAANTAGGVWIRCEETLGPDAGLVGIRGLTKVALTGAAAARSGADDITTIARVLPRSVLAKAMASLGAPDAAVSNLGDAPTDLRSLAGVTASAILVRAATRPLPATVRRASLPAIAAWMIGDGETLTVSIVASHPDHLGVGADTDALVTGEFARWGLRCRDWGRVSGPEVGEPHADLVEKASDER